jgi:tetratricopeptide (TPR) repeat protein
VLGAGGGGWAALYEQYQNNPYTSRQAHNFYLQYWVEVGTVGIVVFTAFLLSVFYLFIRQAIRRRSEPEEDRILFYIVAVSLLTHSLIDFEMSYAFLAALVFLCLGGMAAYGRHEPVRASYVSRLSRWRIAYPALLGVIAVVALIASLVKLNANTLFKTALTQLAKQRPYEEIVKPLNEALKLQPYHPEYAASKLALLRSAFIQTNDPKFYDEAVGLIEQVQKSEPNHRLIFEEAYALYMQKGELEKALALIEKGLTLYPWDITVYDRAASLYVELGNRARLQNNRELTDRYWRRVDELYNEVLDRIERLASLPKGQMQGRPFDVTPGIRFALGQIRFIRGDYAGAADLLQPAISDDMDDETNRQIARWYLAALGKQGKADQALYDKLVGKDPNEQQKIDALLRATF